ncbi:MAG: bacterial domain protein [Proteobacteria bacterium]|nr:bacterial domain protein [Pseudomonadota bacterium]
MLKSLLSIAALTAAATVAAPAVASASPAQVTANVNLRAGPGTQYYPIVVLPAGAPVELYGCLQGYTWCDVSYGRERGWVSSRYLSTFYSGPVYRPRPYRSVPSLTFNFGYWDNHYADRSWYHNRPRDWDRNPDWGRPRPDWGRDRDRQDWSRDRDRRDFYQDQPRPDWNRDRRDGDRPPIDPRTGRPFCPDDAPYCPN